MKKLMHFIKYHFNKQYRTKYDNRKRFAQIMAVNNSILEGR